MAGDELRALAPALPSRRDAIFRRLLVGADLLAALVGLILADVISHQHLSAMSIATLPIIVLVNKLGGCYDRDEVVLRKSTLDEAPMLTLLVAPWTLAWSLVTLGFGVHSSRGALLVLWMATSASMIIFRAGARHLAHRVGPPERALIIGEESERRGLEARLVADSSAPVEIVGYVPLDGDSDNRAVNPDMVALSANDMSALIADLDIDRLIVVPPRNDSESVFDWVATAHSVGLKVSLVPSLFEVFGSAVEFDELGGVTALGLRRPGLSPSSAFIKRTFDIVGATTALIVLAPVGILAAIAIKLDSPGPVFFRQPRVGRNDRRFQMIKLRSMVATAEEQRGELEALNETDGVFKIMRDPRVTRVGRFLREHSLDELPQLINVIRGDMSLVGPRPLLPEEDCQIEGHHRTRLQLRPGITGPWQVLGPRRPPLSEMVKIDYLYRANWSLWSDIKFILRTTTHVAARRGR